MAVPSTSRGARFRYHRDGLPDPHGRAAGLAYLHLGLYAYRREFLLELGALPPSTLEAAEKLEQLRVLEAGFPIAVGIVDEPSVGIDTPEDYRRFVERWRRAPAMSLSLSSTVSTSRTSFTLSCFATGAFPMIASVGLDSSPQGARAKTVERTRKALAS